MDDSLTLGVRHMSTPRADLGFGGKGCGRSRTLEDVDRDG